MDPHYTCQPWRILRGSTHSRNAAALEKQYAAEHKILLKSYNDYLGVEEAGKELILYAAGDNVLALLKKQYIGFGDLMVLSMIDHLWLKMATKMTTAQKHEYKTTRYNNPWDPTTRITAYFTQLNQFQVSLGNCGNAASNAEKIMAAETQMWQSKCSQKTRWLRGRTRQHMAQQTWAEL
jgi:hypothetical protein